MDFLQNQQLIYTSKKYEKIYIVLNNLIDLKYQDLFILCASIGFKNNRKEIVVEKSRELRSNYFSREQKTTAYSIILNDSILGKNINKFEEKEFIIAARKCLEQYAEGGMSILVEDVFKYKWTGGFLDDGYGEYDIDLISYIYKESLEVPF